MEHLQKLNQCLLEIRNIENQRMLECAKENKVYDASVVSWCQIAEKILNDYILLLTPSPHK